MAAPVYQLLDEPCSPMVAQATAYAPLSSENKHIMPPMIAARTLGRSAGASVMAPSDDSARRAATKSGGRAEADFVSGRSASLADAQAAAATAPPRGGNVARIACSSVSRSSASCASDSRERSRPLPSALPAKYI